MSISNYFNNPLAFHVLILNVTLGIGDGINANEIVHLGASLFEICSQAVERSSEKFGEARFSNSLAARNQTRLHGVPSGHIPEFSSLCFEWSTILPNCQQCQATSAKFPPAEAELGRQ